MQLSEIISYLRKQDYNLIFQACTDILIWKCSTGILPNNSIVRVFCEELHLKNYYLIEDAIIALMSENKNFCNAVKLMFIERPNFFIDTKNID